MKRGAPMTRLNAIKVGTLLIGILTVGCKGSVTDDRDAMLARMDAARLVGVWDVAMMLDHPFLIGRVGSGESQPVAGTIAFTENRQGERDVEDFGVVTDRGASDLDLHSFSLPLGRDDHDETVVARTSSVLPTSRGGPDSVFVLLRSADGQLSVLMSGLLEGDSIRGRWAAEYLRNGTDGRFTMRRHASRP
jgi:hypothetical protein